MVPTKDGIVPLHLAALQDLEACQLLTAQDNAVEQLTQMTTGGQVRPYVATRHNW